MDAHISRLFNFFLKFENGEDNDWKRIAVKEFALILLFDHLQSQKQVKERKLKIFKKEQLKADKKQI